jgi:hypothetical protein
MRHFIAKNVYPTKKCDVRFEVFTAVVVVPVDGVRLRPPTGLLFIPQVIYGHVVMVE